MAKVKNIYVCSACGFESAKWLGKCPACSEWNTLEETVVKEEVKTLQKGVDKSTSKAFTQRLCDVTTLEQERFLSGSKEFDRVLGGGIVPASIVLCGGDPGIGKSTLILQICDNVKIGDSKILYVSGEESKRQLKLRSTRLNINSNNLYVMSETNISTKDTFKPKIKAKLPPIRSIIAPT